jgi:hypothetical protein
MSVYVVVGVSPLEVGQHGLGSVQVRRVGRHQRFAISSDETPADISDVAKREGDISEATLAN